jgi:hypothetical protein
MKTTLEISDSLFHRAKAFARSQHTTLRALTEEGLARVLDEREVPVLIQLKPVTFKGKGLSPEFQTGEWARFRDAAYGEEDPA